MKTNSDTQELDVTELDKELQKESNLPKQEYRKSSSNLKHSKMVDGKYYKQSMEYHSTDNIKSIIPFTGEEDIDKILSKDYKGLSPNNQLVRMWGCRNCHMRGTDLCPYGIQDGMLHPDTYCKEAITLSLIEYKSMRTPDGVRHVRNRNIVNMKRLIDKYTWKLNRISKSNTVTKSEMLTLKHLIKMYTGYNEMIDKTIKQDEGIKIKHEKTVTPEDLNYLLMQANEKIVDVKVIEDEELKTRGSE